MSGSSWLFSSSWSLLKQTLTIFAVVSRSRFLKAIAAYCDVVNMDYLPGAIRVLIGIAGYLIC